jgi:hypothetical protein
MPSASLPLTGELFPEVRSIGPCPVCRHPAYRPDCPYCDIRKCNHAGPTPELKAAWAASAAQWEQERARQEAAAKARRERLLALGRPVRVALVGCGKAKRAEESTAAELYTGSLFRAAYGWAKANADEVFILSALYGLLNPEARVQPYEYKLSSVRKVDRHAWGSRVAGGLASAYVGQDVELVFLAGEDYVAPVCRYAPRNWARSVPLEGLTLGQRLAWFSQARRAA